MMRDDGPADAKPGRTLPRAIDGPHLLGLALVGASAVFFSLSVILAHFVYDAGGNPVTLIQVRFLIGIPVLALLVIATRRGFALPRRKLLGSLFMGVSMAVSSIAYFASFTLIPVSLAVLIFYTFPILVGVAVRFTEGVPLTPGKLGALVLAFVGVALALNVDFSAYDGRGLLLALVPALVIGAVTLFGSRLVRDVDVRVVSFYVVVGGAAMAGVVVGLGAEIEIPQSAAGFWSLFGVALGFIAGNLCYLAAFNRVRSAEIAMMMNLEPVATIALAIVLLGDWLTPVQFVGAGLVIIAIFLMTALRKPA